MGSSRALLELALGGGGSRGNGDVSTCHENERKKIEPEEENLAEEKQQEEEEEEKEDERVPLRVPSTVSWDQDMTTVYVRVAVPRCDARPIITAK